MPGLGRKVLVDEMRRAVSWVLFALALASLLAWVVLPPVTIFRTVSRFWVGAGVGGGLLHVEAFTHFQMPDGQSGWEVLRRLRHDSDGVVDASWSDEGRGQRHMGARLHLGIIAAGLFILSIALCPRRRRVGKGFEVRAATERVESAA